MNWKNPLAVVAAVVVVIAALTASWLIINSTLENQACTAVPPSLR
jgi:hypothetical protein